MSKIVSRRKCPVCSEVYEQPELRDMDDHLREHSTNELVDTLGVKRLTIDASTEIRR